MLSYVAIKSLRVLGLLLLLYAPVSLADYELPESTFGFKMVLASHAKAENDHLYIGFLQIKNIKPPFVLIQTTSFDLITAKITSEASADQLVGKIHFPPNLKPEQVKELRINGYSVLWKHAE